MKTFYRGLIVLFCFFIVLNSNAQNLFDIELYGGVNKNYFQVGESATNPDLQFSSPMGQHVGFNFLPRISQNWQLSIQTEWMRSAIKLEYNDFPNIMNQYNHYGNYAIGARYNLEKEKHAFYFQPSVGISMNNYLDPLVDGFGFQNKRDVQFVARAEAGVKFYTKKRNYLLVGLRHQQGFASTTPYGSEEWVGLPLTGRNSYTGLFLGYGINTDNWSKSRRNYEKTTKPKIENPWSDGLYLMGSPSLRKVNDPVNDVSDDFQNVSTSYMFGLGYRFGDFSIEGGYANFRGRNVYQLFNPEGIPINTDHRSFSVSTLPITIRYDRQLPINKKIRVGASFTTHIPVGFQDSGLGVANSGGTRIIDGVAYPYESQMTGLAANPRGVFFNSGIYTEMPLFRTGLITFKASRNFGSPAFDRVQVDYEVGGVPGSFQSQGNLNGWMLEVEYRLPLHHIFKK
jgi:hypothetical protein